MNGPPAAPRPKTSAAARGGAAKAGCGPIRHWLHPDRWYWLALLLGAMTAHADRSNERDFGFYAALSTTYADFESPRGRIEDSRGVRSAFCVTMGKYAGIEFSEHHLHDGPRSATLSIVSLIAEIPLSKRWQLLLRYGLGDLYRDKKEGIASDVDTPELLKTFPLSSPAPVYGFGAQYDLRGGWRLRGELEVFSTMVDNRTHRDSSSLSLGLVYQFF